MHDVDRDGETPNVGGFSVIVLLLVNILCRLMRSQRRALKLWYNENGRQAIRVTLISLDELLPNFD